MGFANILNYWYSHCLNSSPWSIRVAMESLYQCLILEHRCQNALCWQNMCFPRSSCMSQFMLCESQYSIADSGLYWNSQIPRHSPQQGSLRWCFVPLDILPEGGALTSVGFGFSGSALFLERPYLRNEFSVVVVLSL